MGKKVKRNLKFPGGYRVFLYWDAGNAITGRAGGMLALPDGCHLDVGWIDDHHGWTPLGVAALDDRRLIGLWTTGIPGHHGELVDYALGPGVLDASG